MQFYPAECVACEGPRKTAESLGFATGVPSPRGGILAKKHPHWVRSDALKSESAQ